MKFKSNSIKFIFPKNRTFVLQNTRDKRFGWELKTPDYHCLTKSLAHGLYLLGQTAPKRYGTQDCVFVRAESPRGPDEFILTPCRMPFCVNITHWDLMHLGTEQKQKFNDFGAAVNYFVELADLKDKLRTPSPPAELTIV